MNAKQESKLNMYHAVIAHCDAFPAIVATVPAFGTSYTSFKAIVSSLDATVQLEAQVITGIATDKKIVRDTLCQQAADIAAVVYAYATTVANNELAEEVNFSVSDLKRLRDDQTAPTCKNIHDAANDNLAALATYGITAGMLTTFNTLITNYTSKVPATRNAVALRKTYAASIKTLFKQADNLLKKVLDKLAVQFKAANLEFHDTYFNNRIIIDAPTSKTGIKGSIADSVTSNPIAVTATLTLQATTFTTTSDPSGNFKFIKIPNGTYTIVITAPGYQSKQITNVTVTQGQMTTINITLTPA
jgi:hypothetical protein